MMEDVFVHPTALVELDQEGQASPIGPGTRIWAFAHIMAGAVIGADCNIGDHCYVEYGTSLGDGVTVKNGVMIWEGVTLEDGVFVGPHACFTNDLYPRSARLPQAAFRYQPRNRSKTWLVQTRVKRGATLGANCVILAGVVVGEYAMVGAGAVVTRDVAPYALVTGNPASRAAWVCQCGQPLQLAGGRGACVLCGLSYQEDLEGLHLAS